MKKSARILLTLVVPLFLAGVTVAALLLYSLQTEKRSERQTGEVLLTAAKEQNDLLSVKLEGEVSLLYVLAASLNGESEIQLGDTVQRMKASAQASDFRNLIIADASGNGISDEGEYVSLQDRTYLKIALAGETAMEYIAKTRLSNSNASIALAVPVSSENRIIGAAIGILDETVIQKLFQENAYGGSETIVCDAAGTILIGTDRLLNQGEYENLLTVLSALKPEQQKVADQIINEMQTGVSGFAEIEVDGKSWFVAHVPAKYNDWVIVRAIPADVVEGALREEKAQGYLIIGIAMVSALLAALFIVVLYNNAIRNSRRERVRLLNVEEEYRISAQQSGVVIIRIDTITGALISSQGAIEYFQLPESQPDVPFCHSFEALVEEESRADLLQFREKMLSGAPSSKAEICMRNARGTPRWYEFEFSAIGDGGGRSTQAIITIHDITTNRERIAAYRRWQSMLAESVGISAALMEINVSTGVCEHAEGEFATLLVQPGQRPQAQQVLERFCETKVEAGDRAKFGAFVSLKRLLDLFRRDIQTDETELRLFNTDGSVRLCTLTAQVAYAPKTDEVKAFLMLRDFENISKQMDRLSDLALRDGLSGLLNRTAARNAIQEALVSGSGDTVALFMIDADNFKMVNDLLGHQHGDLALKQMSDIIRSTFRATDIIARIGGDEFFVFLSEVPGEEFAENKAAALCNNLRLTYAVEARGSITLTASVGIIVAQRATCDYDWLYSEVDRALYDAKNAGKNRYSIRFTDKAGVAKSGNSVAAGSALQLNALMKQLDGGVLLAEVGEQIEPLFISDGYFMLRGVMREALANQTFPESVIHPHDFPYVNEAVRACATEGTPLQISYRNVLAGGGYGWRHMNAVRVPNPRGDKPAILAVISDITELHNAAEHLESLATASQLGIFILRVGERLEVTFFNDGVLSITGFTYEQMRLFSRDISAFFRGGNLKRFRSEVDAATAENRMVDYLYESQGFMGKKAHNIRLYGVKLDIQNGVPSYLIILLEQEDLV